MRTILALLLLLAPSLVAAKPPAKKSASAPAVKASTQAAADFSLPLYPPTTAEITAALVLDRFTRFDESLASLTCTFAQVVSWNQSDVTQIIDGSLEYRKPQLLHIEQLAPEPQTLVSDGSWLWIWRRSTDQVIQTKLDDWKRSEPLAQGLLDFGKYADMLRDYDVSISSLSAADAKGYRAVELTLRPKEKKKEGDFLMTFKLTTRDFFPAETALRAGQVYVRSSFKNIRVNAPIADERFRFTPPPGADVFQNFKPPKAE